MPDSLEYITTGALMECSEGTIPAPFQATFRNVKIAGVMAANETDKIPLLNIPSFLICRKLTQMAGGTPVPCVPVLLMWQDTYPVRINGSRTLLFKSCIRCTSGQGKIEFMTSGQIPLPPANSQSLEELEELEKEAKELMEQAEAEENSVGEAGFAESLILVWGSGRDMVHAIQTGDGWGAALNAGFLVWDVVSIGAGLVTFGGATVAMARGKAAVKAAFKAGVKTGAKTLGKAAARVLREKAAALLAKAAAKRLALKTALKEGLDAFAKKTFKRCMFACFPAGTPVSVVDGFAPIESLRVGDRVWSRDEQTNKLALQPVVAISERRVDALIAIRVGDEVIRSSAEHPFKLSDGSWKAAAELAGDV